MVGFYSSIIFIGIILIVVSLIWILFDKKEALDTELRIDEKKAELLKIISDAEIMLEELNKISDYVVTRIEEKNNEMDLKFIEAEKLIDTLRNEMASLNPLQEEVVKDSLNLNINHKLTKTDEIPKVETAKENTDEDLEGLNKDIKEDTSASIIEDNVVSINSKHDEVIMLAKKGLNETEIARKLNIGKGEIQLILGVNR